MSVTLKGGNVIFRIPDSEAITAVQRKGIKVRSVGSFYLSGIQDDVERALNGLKGRFYVDLLQSYHACRAFYAKLTDVCGHLFRRGLSAVTKVLLSLENLTVLHPSTLFFEICPPRIIPSRKYFKWNDGGPLMDKFRILCIGDVSEIVIQRLSSDAFRIFVRPREDVVEMMEIPGRLEGWLISLRKAVKPQ